MSNSILQQYLSLQFIPIDDENGADKLKKSADQLEKKLKKDKHRIPSFVLLALDPGAPPSEPIFQEVQELIIKNWPVYINKAGGQNLVTYNRAVMLEALNSLAAETEVAGIIWLTGTQVLKHGVSGRETTTLTEWVYAMGKKYESKARQLWATDNIKLDFETPAFAPAPELKTVGVNRDYLFKRLMAAAGPNYVNDAGETVGTEKGNSHWPSGNANWVTMFGRIASEGVVAATNSGLTGVSKEFSTYTKQFEDSIKDYFVKLSSYFQEVADKMQAKNHSLDLRSQLLWIKESQYSSCLLTSYRELDPSLLPFAISKDVADAIPPVYPVSIDYFSKEIARVSSDDADTAKPITALLDAISNNGQLKDLLPQPMEQAGRIGLLNFISGLCHKKTILTDIEKLTGIPAETRLSANDLLVWMLHEIQILKLSHIK